MGLALPAPLDCPRKAAQAQNSPWAKLYLGWGRGNKGGRGQLEGKATEATTTHPAVSTRPASKKPHACSQKCCLSRIPVRSQLQGSQSGPCHMEREVGSGDKPLPPAPTHLYTPQPQNQGSITPAASLTFCWLLPPQPSVSLFRSAAGHALGLSHPVLCGHQPALTHKAS